MIETKYPRKIIRSKYLCTLCKFVVCFLQHVRGVSFRKWMHCPQCKICYLSKHWKSLRQFVISDPSKTNTSTVCYKSMKHLDRFDFHINCFEIWDWKWHAQFAPTIKQRSVSVTAVGPLLIICVLLCRISLCVLWYMTLLLFLTVEWKWKFP